VLLLLSRCGALSSSLIDPALDQLIACMLTSLGGLEACRLSQLCLWRA